MSIGREKKHIKHMARCAHTKTRKQTRLNVKRQRSMRKDSNVLANLPYNTIPCSYSSLIYTHRCYYNHTIAWYVLRAPDLRSNWTGLRNYSVLFSPIYGKKKKHTHT